MRNEIRRYRRDGEAVSPVIGTILMVAVTVVLAAVLYIVVSPMINTADVKPEENILIRQGAVSGNLTVPGTYDTFYTVVSVSSIQKYPDPDLSFVIMADSGSLLTDATIRRHHRLRRRQRQWIHLRGRFHPRQGNDAGVPGRHLEGALQRQHDLQKLRLRAVLKRDPSSVQSITRSSTGTPRRSTSGRPSPPGISRISPGSI